MASSAPDVPAPLTNSVSSSPSLEPSLPPLDPPAQRHRRHHLAGYFRTFSAVIRRKTSDLTRSHSTPNASSQAAAGDSTPDGPSENVDIPSNTPLPIRDEAANSQKRRKTLPLPSVSSHSSRQSSTWTAASRVTTVSRQAARDERASFLHTRYGLGNQPVLGSSTPQPIGGQDDSSTVLRIQKKPRLRMHVTCHECNTILGKSSICSQCGHRRCRQCPRAAPKGVRSLIEQTKRDLESISEPKTDKPGSTASGARRTIPRNRFPLISRAPLNRQYPFSAGHDLALLVPDPSSSDDEEGPLPSLNDFYRVSYPSMLGRKRGRSGEDGGYDARGYDCCYGPRRRVYRKIRQRTRRVCTLCRHVHSGTEQVCTACRSQDMRLAMVVE